MTEHSKKTEKAFKQVADAADNARKLVRDQIRNARAEFNRAENERLSREAKKLKRDKHLSNHQIAEKMDISESSVRALLMMKIKGEV